ncbi:MAG: MarR family transcriptional regulator [Dehalobacter sp. 4CP]|uniref:MarR family winged helix-turn-helix transcriptional regulator n=1 Tax=Dehalobacter sp. CP TaxID=2594474 RepID=UPI0013C9A453|nr:MarR family transcriptional regulator [Dehalobacter sp. 4CP]
MQNKSELLKELTDVGHLFRKILTRPIESNCKVNVKPSQKYALIALSSHSEMTMSELGRDLLVSKQQLTIIVGELLRKGYVERYLDKNNLRIVYVRLTEEGRNALNEIYTHVETGLSSKLDLLSAEELDALMSAAVSIKKSLEKIDENE